MSNEAGEPDGLPDGPLPGAVRFTADGHLEIYGEDGWQPLVRMSDVDLPPVFRVDEPAEGAAYAAEDSYAAEDNGGDPDRQPPP